MLTPVDKSTINAITRTHRPMDVVLRYETWLSEENIYQVQGLVNLEELLTQQGYGGC